MMVESLKIIQAEPFFLEVEKLVVERGLSYIEAIVLYCEKNNIEIETAAALIRTNTKIKSALLIEGEDLNFLTKTRRLPV